MAVSDELRTRVQPFVAKYGTRLKFDMHLFEELTDVELIYAMSAKINEAVCFDNETREMMEAVQEEWRTYEANLTEKVDAAIDKIPSQVTDEVNRYTSSDEFQKQIDATVEPVVEKHTQGMQAQIDANKSAISGLQTAVAGKADASALGALTERVSTVEGTVSEQGESIATNTEDIAGLRTSLSQKADQSALTALTGRVTQTETKNSTQDEEIEALQEQVAGIAPTARLKNVIVIGDSWTNGTQGGDDVVYRFTDYMTNTGSFKHVYNRGVGGAGFGTSRETTFLQIAQAAKAANEPADAIIVFGGCNDDAEDVDAQVTATFNYLKSNWPKADLYFAHNINRNSLMANFLQVNSREAAAMTAGAAVIQGFPQVLRNMDNYFTPEKWHMTTQAYKYIGAVFCAVLKGCEMPLPSYMHSVTESGQWAPAGATFIHWQKTMDGPLCQNLIQLTTTQEVAVGGMLGRLNIEMIPPIATNNSIRCFAMFSSGSTQSISECLIDHQGNVTVSQTIPNGSAIHLQISYPQKSLQIIPVPNPIDVNSIDAL